MTDDLTRPEVLRLLKKRIPTGTTESTIVKDEDNCLVKAYLRREQRVLEEFGKANW